MRCAVCQAADTFVLHKPAVCIFGEHAGDFKHAHTVVLAVQVVLQDFHQPADEGGAHHGVLCRQRVLQADWVCISGKIPLPLFVYEGVAHDFLIAACCHFLICGKTRAAVFRLPQHGQPSVRVFGGDVFIAVHAGDFFYQIGFYFNVVSEGWCGNGKSFRRVFGLQAEALQDFSDAFGGNVCTQHFGHARAADGNTLGCGQLA